MCNLCEYDMTEEDMRLLMEHYKRIIGQWPEGSFDEALALQRPAPDEALTVSPPGPRERAG